jgi:hypothetical protein
VKKGLYVPFKGHLCAEKEAFMPKIRGFYVEDERRLCIKIAAVNEI